MVQENEKLLFKALCALLPYNTIVSVAKGEADFTGYKIKWYQEELTSYLLHQIEEEGGWEFIKPYLRPMSSMTEEERKELISLCSVHYTVSSGMDKFHLSLDIGGQVGTNLQRVVFYNNVVDIKILDYLNEHHFDYRDLIEKGLAIKAPEGMYNISNN